MREASKGGQVEHMTLTQSKCFVVASKLEWEDLMVDEVWKDERNLFQLELEKIKKGSWSCWRNGIKQQEIEEKMRVLSQSYCRYCCCCCYSWAVPAASRDSQYVSQIYHVFVCGFCIIRYLCYHFTSLVCVCARLSIMDGSWEPSISSSYAFEAKPAGNVLPIEFITRWICNEQ